MTSSMRLKSLFLYLEILIYCVFFSSRTPSETQFCIIMYVRLLYNNIPLFFYSPRWFSLQSSRFQKDALLFIRCLIKVARWYICIPKIPIGNILVGVGRENVGIFYSQYFYGNYIGKFCGNLVYFSTFWYVVPKKSGNFVFRTNYLCSIPLMAIISLWQ
jgi:hypothetical protein